ncbi:MAG: hypothetical protein FWC73_14380, partial [Defluviitaleaceae bacterium]|nr:hypothetical protein [Defluviitaleaceae bacterium]
MKSASRIKIIRVSVLLAFTLLVSATMMFIFAGNNDGLEARLANMNVTTISTVVRGNRTVTNGNALVITGSGRVEGNITVASGALLVVEGNPSPLSGNNGDRGIQGRVILNGGDFYMLSGGLWNPTGGMTLAPSVIINNGGNFTMRDGVIRSTGNNGTFGVDIINGNFTMHEGTIMIQSGFPAAPAARLASGNNGTFVMYGGVLQMPATNPSGAVGISGGTFYMNGGAIRHNPNQVSRGVSVIVRGDGNNSGTFIMNGGEIYNGDTGVEISGANAEFIMNGGTIRDNRSTSGAGVDLSDRARFTMHDGSIANNVVGASTGGGAGVLVTNATFTMYGGTIDGNRAQATNGNSNRGGGVGVLRGGRFYMYGGYIENNVAGAGGGVHIMSSSSLVLFGGTVNHNSYMKLDGGTIRNNEAIYGDLEHGGGGVALLVSAVPVGNSVATFDMYSGYITGNSASSSGGGRGAAGVSGGGVSVAVASSSNLSVTSNPNAVFNMHGGTIADNTAWCGRTNSFANDLHNIHVMGGGVSVFRRGSFNMFGGLIEGNSSIAGGGVGLSSAVYFNMYGGTIRSNEAYGGYERAGHPIVVDRGMELRGGGGVYLHATVIGQSHTPIFNMYGGSIIENISPDGGGIFWVCSAHRAIIDGINDPFQPPNVWDLRSDQAREFPLTRVYVSAQAVVQNNIATNGTRVDNELWGRHRAEDPTVNWGGDVVTRSVPAPNGGTFNHLFNNHDIKTRTGEAYDPVAPDPQPPTFHRVAFYIVNPLDGEFGCGNNPVIHYIEHGQPITADLIPSVYAYWVLDFTGWGYSNGDPVSDPVEGRIVTGDIIFIALFEPAYYTIYFRSGDGGLFYTGANMISREFRRGHIIGPNDIPLIETFPNFQLSNWTPWNPSGMMVLTIYDGHVFTAIYTHNRRVTFHAEAGGYLSFGYEYVENGETLEYYQIPTPYA